MVLCLLAQAQDTARAHAQASFVGIRDSLESLVVSACRDDARVELARSIDVVIVRRQPGLLELLGLRQVDHAEGDTALHSQVLDALDHLLDVAQVCLAPAHVTPRSTHAEACASVLLCDTSSGEDGTDLNHLRGLEAGVVTRGLCAVGAVLAATASLDVDERAHLDFGWVVELLVDGALE